MPYNEFEWDREQIFRDTPRETWVPRKDAEREIQDERGRNAAIGTSLRDANSNAEILAARIRVLEGEKRDLESRIVAGARREASLGVDIEDCATEIKRLRETQIPTLNTIQKARYKHGTRFDSALGLKGDESLEVVIPIVIDRYMTLKTMRDDHDTVMSRIHAKVDDALPGLPTTYGTEGRVEVLATAFKAVKVRLGTAVDALQQVQIAMAPQPKLDLESFKIGYMGPRGPLSAAYLFTGV